MRAPKIVFLVPPEVHMLDLGGPVQVFQDAMTYGATLELCFISYNDQTEITTSCGLALTHLQSYKNLSLVKGDFLFIPGMERRQLLDQDFIREVTPFLQWMVMQHEQGVAICSVCTGAFLLAESGILNGKQCTTHWRSLDLFSERYPDTELLSNRLFVEQDNIYTSAGVASGIDLALYILEQKFGSKLASDVAREVVVYMRRSEQDPQLSIFLKYRNHQENRVHEVQNWLISNLSENFTIEDLAERVHTSPRNLTRLFKKSTGITLGQYLDKLRVESAIQLIREGQKVEAVATICGLKSANQLRSIIKKYTGLLPHELQAAS